MTALPPHFLVRLTDHDLCRNRFNGDHRDAPTSARRNHRSSCRLSPSCPRRQTHSSRLRSRRHPPRRRRAVSARRNYRSSCPAERVCCRTARGTYFRVRGVQPTVHVWPRVNRDIKERSTGVHTGGRVQLGCGPTPYSIVGIAAAEILDEIASVLVGMGADHRMDSAQDSRRTGSTYWQPQGRTPKRGSWWHSSKIQAADGTISSRPTSARARWSRSPPRWLSRSGWGASITRSSLWSTITWRI